MKKFKVLIYIVLIIVIGVLAFFIFKNVNKNNDENSSEKSLSEIKYMEKEIVNLLNSMNNIESRNYKVVVGKMPEKSKEETNSESSESSGSGQEQQSSSSQDDGSGSSESQDSSSGGGSGEENQASNESLNAGNESEQDNQKFELKSNGVLLNNEDVNWDIVKSAVENLYLSIPTITIDLYNENVNQDEVLSFNKEYDNLAVVVKDEKKVETLAQLSKIYDFLPKFVNQNDVLYKTLVETKASVFKAYSKLDDSKWEEISNDIKNAIDSYSKLLTNTNIDSNKQYSINRGYIMLNELQNAVAIQDTSVFLIKYKNLIDEVSNI